MLRLHMQSQLTDAEINNLANQEHWVGEVVAVQYGETIRRCYIGAAVNAPAYETVIIPERVSIYNGGWKNRRERFVYGRTLLLHKEHGDDFYYYSNPLTVNGNVATYLRFNGLVRRFGATRIGNLVRATARRVLAERAAAQALASTAPAPQEPALARQEVLA